LYNRSGGSILLVAVWHGVYNAVSGTQAATGVVAAVVSTLIMAQALLLVGLDLRARHRGKPPRSAPPSRYREFSATDGPRSHRSTADSADDHWGNVWAAAPRPPRFAAIAVVTGPVLATCTASTDMAKCRPLQLGRR
jgi:hypothetical protein